ncbi:MAG: FkbM family methyltransferase [Verrucomicrobiota bacterium]|jgi:FkbM family methyltransferase
MNPFLYGQKLDLVDFEDVKLLMFRDDSLYQVTVSEDRKNRSLREHFLQVSRHGYPKSVVSPANLEQVSAARFGLFIYLHHLWQQNLEFTVLDLGSHVGDFSIKVANFARTFQKKLTVIAFDPTPAGALVQYNVQINGLEDYVRHEDLAVSDFNGLIKFQALKGHSDSPSAFRKAGNEGFWSTLTRFIRSKHKRNYFQGLVSRIKGKEIFEFVAKSVTICDYLDAKGIHGHLFVKIDIEGLDECVLSSLLPRAERSLISIVTEFTPSSFRTLAAAARLLEDLGRSFVIYDIFYSPNPTRFDRVEPRSGLDFARHIQEDRKYGYTDILLIPKAVPGLERLLKRLDALERAADAYVL